MSSFLALDWEKHRLTGLDAEVVKSRVRVRSCLQFNWPEESAWGLSAAEAGDALKTEIERLGVRARHVLVALPREDVAVRLIEVPDVPDTKLPDLVYLQAETRSASTLEGSVLDFVPLPKSTNASMRQVLVVTIARERIDHIRKVVEAAGCELISVGVSPVATAELVAHVESRQTLGGNGTSLVVAGHAKRLEISLLRERHLLFTHSAHLTGEDDQQDNRQIVTEIRRFMGARSQVDQDVAVSRAWVIGSRQSAALCESLRDLLSCDAGTIDVLSDAPVEYRGKEAFGDDVAFAAPVGMLLTHTGALLENVDFLNPRKSVVETDRRPLQAGAVAAVAVLACTLAFGGSWWRTSRLEFEIADKQEQLTRLADAVNNGQPTLETARQLSEWDAHNIDWLAQMHGLNTALPDRERIYLIDAKMGLSPGSGNDKINATGFARSRRDVEKFYQRFAQQQYRVEPHEISSDERDGEYPYRFQLEATLASDQQSATQTPETPGPEASIAR